MDLDTSDLDTSELGGDLTFQLSDSHAAAGVAGLVVLRVEQDLGDVRYGGWVPLAIEALDDPPIRTYALQRAVDALRPWRRPDPAPFPALDLFPRATAARRWLRNLRKDRL